MDFTSLTCCPLSSPTICGFQRSGILENFSAILTLSTLTSAEDFRIMRTPLIILPCRSRRNMCDEAYQKQKSRQLSPTAIPCLLGYSPGAPWLAAPPRGHTRTPRWLLTRVVVLQSTPSVPITPLPPAASS